MSDTPTPSAIGCRLPDFSAASVEGGFASGRTGSRWLVMYFYPKDDTPGCTMESRDFALAHGEFTALGASVVGVSRDSLASHEKFRRKFDLPFDLISDPDETVCNLFNVMKMKNMYGKTVRGIERSTFLIDPQGILRREWRGVKVPGHVAEVLGQLRQLQAAQA